MEARRGRVAGPSLVAGLLVAASVPPAGWWPLGIAGLALLAWRLNGLAFRGRALAGWLAGLGLFGVTLFWMSEFTVPGAVLAIAAEATFVAVAAAAVPPGPLQPLAFAAALVLAEALRAVVPFGGIPLGGVDLGQAAGPLAANARLGGALLVTGVAALGGAALACAVRRRWPLAAALAAAVVLTSLAGGRAGDGRPSGPPLRVAVVQGGGQRGFRAVETDQTLVFEAQLHASRRLRPPLDLVLWPEDVIDVDGDVRRTPEGQSAAALARRVGATVVAGVVEGRAGGERFSNAAVAWGPGGRVVARYEKVQRVPFGEYVPARELVDRVADLSAVPRDALVGRGPGVLRTPAGTLGVLVSYEVFFARRARSSIRAGAEVVLVPTNAASFSTSQVPEQELAAARLRAWETGRPVVQAAPTGYSAIIDHRGRVRARSGLGERWVMHARVTPRSGRTPYGRTGDAPTLVLAAIGLALAWQRGRRPAHTEETSPLSSD